MKRLALAVALSFLAAWPAQAAEGDLDLGFARAGMALGEFRQGGWPEGASVLCSGDDGLPDDDGPIHFSVPKGVARLGGLRCGVFTWSEQGWHPQPLEVAGRPTELWALFFPDRAGTPRLLQLLLKQPPDSFAALADYFTAQFGPARMRAEGLARWDSEQADAAIIKDGGKLLHAYLIDNRLQAALNARMSQHPRLRGDKRDVHP